jgi:hypothetical protein
LKLQQTLPDGTFRIDARGVKEDATEPATWPARKTNKRRLLAHRSC